MNYIDLFAGCGGLSLGLHNAGLKGLFAVEKNEDAFLTLKYNLIDNKNHFSCSGNSFLFIRAKHFCLSFFLIWFVWLVLVGRKSAI